MDGGTLPAARAPGVLDSVAARSRTPPEAKAVQQNALTVFVKIRQGKVDELRVLLESIGKNLHTNPYIQFGELTTTHFCRFVIVPGDPDLDAPASLAFASNFDGDLDAYLDELIAVARRGLDAIYGLCDGYPGSSVSAGAVKDFLRQNSLPYGAFYKGHPGLSQRWIKNDIDVRHVIESFLQEQQKTPGWPPSPSEIRTRIQAHLAKFPGLSTALFDRDLPTWKDALPWLIPASLAGIVALPLVIEAAIVYAILLRYHEIRDKPDSLKTNFPISHLTELEDHTIQNQLTHIVPIKPGLFRLWTLKGVLWAINTLAYYIYNQGELGGIPSIHFARWVIIDGGKRLLFFSNYDGSWENYLGDFIDKASTGLTGVWSNTVGFPKTKWLIYEGATHEALFKQWTRAHQIPTQVWYSAYPDATVPNVINNTAIRGGAQGSLSESKTLEWLEEL
ncbi:hypothetical protein [Sorangium sp. So ce233]|uniref:hypothetical protein n=1 Tax=Sorangium sp. So ce233 TaxID=3133290 RepID=UPI003F60D73E